MSVAYNKFNVTVQNAWRAADNLNTDTLKIALSNTLPVNTNTVIGNITEIANGNGYTTGGVTIGGQAFTQVAGLASLVGNFVSWTGAGAGMATFRYVVLYDSSSTNLLGWWDYGSTVTLAVGQVFQWGNSNDGTNWTVSFPILTLQ